MGDFSDGAGQEATAIEEMADAPAIESTPDVPLDIPDVPAIPELSPAEKGEIGTVHAVREDKGSSGGNGQTADPAHDGAGASKQP